MRTISCFRNHYTVSYADSPGAWTTLLNILRYLTGVQIDLAAGTTADAAAGHTLKNRICHRDCSMTC